MPEVENRAQPNVQNQEISPSDLKLAKEIRLKRDDLNYKDVRLERW